MECVLVDFSEEEWQVSVVRRKTKCWRSLSVQTTFEKNVKHDPIQLEGG